LISPDVHQPTSAAFDTEHVYPNTATWRPVPLFDRDFTTTNSASYLNPKDQKQIAEHHEVSEEELAERRRVRDDQIEAVEALCKTAKAHFGTTASMMKVVRWSFSFEQTISRFASYFPILPLIRHFIQFNKKAEDSISLQELNEYMKRNKIDQHISKDERKKIFDFVDPHHKGEIVIRDLLQKTEKQEFQDSDHTENMFKIREFLRSHLDKLRVEKEAKLHRDPDLEHRKKGKAVPKEKHLIKTAIGQKTFDLDVDHDELHEVIEHLHTKVPTEIEERKFARFLRHSNLNLAIIPFYDMRHEDLEHLKARAARIDRTFTEPDGALEKLGELEKTRWRSSLATTNEQDPLTMSVKYDTIMDGRMQLSRSMSHLPIGVRPSPLSVSTSGPLTSSKSAAALPTASPAMGSGRAPLQLSPVNPRSARSLQTYDSSYQQASVSTNTYTPNESSYTLGSESRKLRPKPRDLTPSQKSLDEVSVANTDYIGSVASEERNPKRYTTALKLKEDLFHEQEQSQESDFYTQIVSENSVGKMKDPSKVMRVEKIDSNAYLPTGKRAVHSGPTDWSRLGVGGGNDASNTGYGRSDDDPFMTTNSKFYPPLIYKSSQAPSRDLVSETEINYQKKVFQRSERYARLKANMEVTETRLEYEQVQKEVRNLRRDHGRVEDRIRYQTAMFLNDLKAYKSQPLVRMAKKQNIHLADRMWNGNADPHVSENRDFMSTYNASYDSATLRLSDTLVHPPTSQSTGQPAN